MTTLMLYTLRGTTQAHALCAPPTQTENMNPSYAAAEMKARFTAMKSTQYCKIAS
jgi:hypothetical protein